MSTIGFARFNKQFASGGITTPLSDAQAAAGWSFLGTSPPTVEEFNAMMQSFDDKDNYLFGNLSTLATNAGVSAPADGDFTTLYKAVVALLVSGVGPVALTGTSTAYLLANTLPVGAYANGQKFRATVNVTSGNAPTLKVDALAVIPIYGRGASPLQTGEMPVNSIATFEILISATVNGGSPVAVLGQAAGGPLQVATATQSGHATTLAQLQAAQGNYAQVVALNTSQALTAAQMSGGYIDWFGPSGGTLTLPLLSTLAMGKTTKLCNYGLGTLNLVVSGGSDFIYNGLSSSITTVVLQRGDDIELVARGTTEIDIVGGAAMRQYYPLTVGAATGPTHALQAGQALGLYLGTQTISASGTYTPGTYTVAGRSVTASKAHFRGQAAGGAGGGAVATGAGQASAGSGGNAGNPFDFWVTAGLAAMSITFGAPGTGVSAANGNSGGNLVIGSIATITGGLGGGVGGLVGSFPVFNALNGNQNAASTIASAGGMTLSGIINSYGQMGYVATLLAATAVQAGQGGLGAYGSVAYGSASGNLGYGIGGNGALNGPSVAAKAGASGLPAVLVIDEYA